MLLRHCLTEKYMYQQQTRRFLVQVCYRRQLSYSPVSKQRESLRGRLIRRGPWPQHPHDLTPCDLFVGMFQR